MLLVVTAGGMLLKLQLSAEIPVWNASFGRNLCTGSRTSMLPLYLELEYVDSSRHILTTASISRS